MMTLGFQTPLTMTDVPWKHLTGAVTQCGRKTALSGEVCGYHSTEQPFGTAPGERDVAAGEAE